MAVLVGEAVGLNGKAAMLLRKVDETNGTVWTDVLSQSDDCIGYGIVERANGILAVAGYTKAFGNGGADMYLLRVLGKTPEVGMSSERPTARLKTTSQVTLSKRQILDLCSAVQLRRLARVQWIYSLLELIVLGSQQVKS